MFIFYVYFILLFLASSLYLTSSFNSIGNIAISLIVLTIFPIVIITKKMSFKLPVYNFILIFIFSISVVISVLFNGDLSIMINGMMIAILYFSSYVLMQSYDFNVNKVIYKSAMISHIPLILIPIIVFGFDSNPYRGIFYNPNSFGTTVTTLFALIIGVFFFKLENYYTGKIRQKTISLFVYLIGVFLTFFLIGMSGSRTSLTTALVLLFVGFSFVFISLIKNRMIGPFIKAVFFTGLSFIVVLFLAKITSFYDVIYNKIIYKFELKLGKGDVLDTRGIVWEKALAESKLFGNGSNYFETTIAAAHNTFIGILGEQGWIVLVLFVSLLVIGVFTSLKYALSSVLDEFKYIPIMLIICFVTLSMGESMLFKFSMLAMFFSLGSTANVKRRVMDFKEKESIENAVS